MNPRLHRRTGSFVACAACAIAKNAEVAGNLAVAFGRAACRPGAMRCFVPAFVGLLIAGCSVQEDTTPPTRGSGGGDVTGGSGGSTSAGTGTGGFTGGIVPSGGGEGPRGTGGGDFQCANLPETVVELSPEQSRDLAAGQFSVAMVASRWLPPPKTLGYSQVRDYLHDLANVGLGAEENPVSFSLSSSSNAATEFKLTARSTGRAAKATKTNLIVLLDVSPSTSAVSAGRDAVLNSLADGVDAREGYTFSLASFAGTTELIVDRVPAGGARVALDAERTRLAYLEGGDLPGALKTAQGLLNIDAVAAFPFSHVLILTDGGLVPSENTLAQVEALSNFPDVRVSVAQLSTVPLGTAEPLVAPTELRSELLSEIARRGRGLAFYFDGNCNDCSTSEVVDASFERWFAPFEETENFQFFLPGGLSYVPDPTKEPGGDGRAVGLAGVSWERSIELKDECGDLAGRMIQVGHGENTRSALLSLGLAGLELFEDQPRIQAERRLKAVIDVMRGPAVDYCAQIDAQLMAVGPSLTCQDTDFDCRYVTVVDEFVAKAQGLCLN